MSAVLDAISPLERVQISAQLATSLGSLNASPSPLERVRLSGQVAELLRKLGADAQPAATPAATVSEFPLAEAASSYSGISHRGSSNAKADRDTYEGAVARELEAATPLAETDKQKAVLVSEEAAFRSDYLSQYRSLMQVRAATYSSHIAGRSGFNSKQASARNSALDKANDRFYNWFEAQKGRIKAAVLRARSPEQLAAEQAIKDEQQAEKTRKSVEFMVKVLSFKRGDDLRIGQSVITRVSKDKDGYPSKLTFTFADGTKPFDDKIDLLRVLYRGDKEALRRDADAAMALLNPNPEPDTAPVVSIPSNWNEKLLKAAEPADIVTPEQVRALMDQKAGMFESAQFRGEPDEASIQDSLKSLTAARLGKEVERGAMLKQSNQWDLAISSAMSQLALSRTLVNIGTRKDAQAPDGFTGVGAPYFQRAEMYANGGKAQLASARGIAAFLIALERRAAQPQKPSTASFDKHLVTDKQPVEPGPALTAKGNPIIDEAVLLDVGLLYTWNDQWKYKYSAEAGSFFTAPNKAEAIERASDTYANAAPGVLLTRAERDAKADADELAQMQRQYGHMTLQELRDKFESMGGDIASLRAAGKNELSGDGRRTSAAVANEGARDVAEERMRLGRYIATREAEEGTQPAPTPAHPDNGRAPAGGMTGMNGEFYKGGSFLPRTTLPKQGSAPGSTTSGRGWLIEPGVYDHPPMPGARSIFSSYSEFLNVADGVATVREKPDAAIEHYVNPDVAEGRAFLRAAAEAYSAGMRWYMPGQIQPQPEHYKEPEHEIVEHVTKGGKGKTIRGIVRTDLSYAEAKAIDEYTFKKNGGWFIREKHLEGFTPSPTPGRADPAPKVELTPEQIAQAEADRIADAQLKEAQRLRDVASKLRSAGESVVGKADEELGRDRLTNTARRASMAGNIIERHEASRAIGLTMQNLAQAIESGQAVHLNGVTSRVQVELLMSLLRGGKFEAERGLSYTEQLAQRGRPFDAKDVAYTKFPTATAFRDHFKWAAEKLEKKAPTGNSRLIAALRKLGAHPLERFPLDDQKAELARQGYKALQSINDGHYLSTEIDALNRLDRLRRMGITNTMQLQDALREFLEYREGARAEDPIKKAERAIIGQKVGLDFFPTPMATATRMAALARIKKGDRVLEPSAGNGNLADAAKAAGGEVDVVEMSSQLRDILQAKGYSIVGHDFETFQPEEKYDAIVMNPPFSDRRDSAHIQRAFGMLKAGGHLVAIAGEGVFFGSDAKAKQFQQWLEQVGAEVESLDQGTFKDKSLLATTGANARLIVIQK